MAGELIGNILSLIMLVGLGIAGVIAVLVWKKNRASRVTFLRFVIQAVGLAAFFFLFSLEPAIPLLYVLIAWFAVTLFLGRFFCGWVCPFAFIMDIENLLRKALKIRYRLLPDKLNLALHKGRYLIITVFLLFPLILWIFNPPPDTATAIMMARLLAGPFRPYSLIIDPLVPFVVPWTGQLILGNINFSYPYVANITSLIQATPGQIFAIAFVATTLIGAFLVRRIWCRFCPAGVSIAALNKFKAFKGVPLLYIEKDEAKCTKCGVCKRVCPVQVNDVYDQKGGKIKTSQCMLCARCVELCPYEDTLKINLGNKPVFKSRNWLEPSIINEERKIE
ncbi:MAG: 4Fe-4S binding protein [Nitrososphaerota archaeon]|jgi:polyferredoxin|nr:4Fe-4S binding protein [Nitrososphaerota archaeon]